MLYSKKLTCNSTESIRVKVNLDTPLSSSFIFMHHEQRRAGLFSIKVGWEKILPVHRQRGLNLSLKTIGTGVVYHLYICSNENKKLLRNF